MLAGPDLITPELMYKFKVLEVDWGMHAESRWVLEYEGHGPISCDEQFDTLESDEQLVGKMIDAQIELSDCKILPTVKDEKSMNFDGGLFTVTGIYEDDFIDLEFDTVDYIIDSLFRIKIDLHMNIDSMPVKKGEWITLKGLAYLLLPR